MARCSTSGEDVSAGSSGSGLPASRAERCQRSFTALEAMRITAVRALDASLGRENYHLQVRAYPHHVLRQNKQASGAGA